MKTDRASLKKFIHLKNIKKEADGCQDNKKQNLHTEEKILLSSIFSILLCCVMLAGSTLAWFTASVSTPVTNIQAGTLSLYAGPATAAYDLRNQGNGLGFASHSTLMADGSEEEDDNFNAEQPVLWQPGDVYTLQPMYVANTGTMDMQYQVLLSFTESLSDNGEEGETDEEKAKKARENLKLLQALKFTVTAENLGEEEPLTAEFSFPQDDKEFADMITEVKDSEGSIIGYEIKRVLFEEERFLKAVDEENGEIDRTAITIKITMPPTTGAAYSGKMLHSIRVIVNVSQVIPDQSTVADYTPVSDAAELFTAVGSGGRIALMNDIELDTSLNIEEGKEIVLELQGYKLSGTVDGFLIQNAGDLTVIGGTLGNTSENGGIIHATNGKVTLTGVTLQNSDPTKALDADKAPDGDEEIVIYGDFDMSGYCDADNYTIGNDSDGNYTIKKN